MDAHPRTALRTLGGLEWLALPEFGIACIQARIDPEVRRSRLQVLDLEADDPEGCRGVRFRIRPVFDDDLTVVEAAAPLAESCRWPAASDERPTIRTLVTLGRRTWPLDLRLVPHDLSGFRMSLGLDAFAGRVPYDAVRFDPAAAFLAGPPAILGPGIFPLDELRETFAVPRPDTRHPTCP